MNVGKIPNELLQAAVISKARLKRDDVLVGPGIGKDCSVVDFGDYACVISTDPITGATQRMGYLGIHVSCNDIATTGAECIGVMMTILAPPSTDLREIEQVMSDADKAAGELGIDILGGHTEVTPAVKQMVLSVTAIGKVLKDKLVYPEKARVGDDIILTKKAGLEGTAILAHERETLLLRHFSKSFLEKAKTLINKISVVNEGRVAGLIGAHAMHDATEGGVLGALWEISEAMQKGITIDSQCIPVAPETREICNFFGIDPLKLISSGCMIIVTPDGIKLAEELRRHNIEASVIGKVVEGNEKWIVQGGAKKRIEPPESDELYIALENEGML